jgi:hypothetical protein
VGQPCSKFEAGSTLKDAQEAAHADRQLLRRSGTSEPLSSPRCMACQAITRWRYGEAKTTSSGVQSRRQVHACWPSLSRVLSPAPFATYGACAPHCKRTWPLVRAYLLPVRPYGTRRDGDTSTSTTRAGRRVRRPHGARAGGWRYIMLGDRAVGAPAPARPVRMWSIAGIRIGLVPAWGPCQLCWYMVYNGVVRLRCRVDRRRTSECRCVRMACMRMRVCMCACVRACVRGDGKVGTAATSRQDV